MKLVTIDWLIIAAYFVLSLMIGLYYARRAGRSTEEYFLSDRSMPWWLAGTSMVATTFAADTPLAVTEMVARNGVAGNWLWWSMLASGMLTVFFFARLWRRSRVMTDVEFVELRYSGKPAAFLRGFRALYLGLPINLIIMGWVNLGMAKVLSGTLGLAKWQALAVFAVQAVGGLDQLKARLAGVTPVGSTEPFGTDGAIQLLPDGSAVWMLPLLTLVVYLGVNWWASWYPGAEPGGGGYVAQRIFSARTERDGLLATLWFNIAHYAVRPWPWILVALASTILYPNLEDPKQGYVMAMVDLLPPGLFGLMVAAFAAAYMSTISTQLNWGASYLVNDLYLRFVHPGADERRLVLVSRLTTLFLMVASLVVTQFMTTIEGAWRFLLAIGAGTGLVLILRWYWWRINAWSEISAMVASFVFSLLAMATLRPRFAPGDPNADAWVMIVTVAASTLVWLGVTLATGPS